MLVMLNDSCSLGSTPTDILNTIKKLGRGNMPADVPSNVADYMSAIYSGIAGSSSKTIDIPRYVAKQVQCCIVYRYIIARGHSNQLQTMRKAVSKLLAPCLDCDEEINDVHLKALREYVYSHFCAILACAVLHHIQSAHLRTTPLPTTAFAQNLMEIAVINQV